jgi:hypothetical protein
MIAAIAAAVPIEEPGCFPERVCAGITLRAVERFPPRGFSVDALSAEDPAVRRLALTLGVAPQQLKFQQQVHGADVRVVTAESPLQPSDGMVTCQPGVVLCVRIADCCAVLLYHPAVPLVAALHAGWRGTAAGVVERALELIHSTFGAAPHELIAYLSPCASGERYEVGPEVASLFPHSVRRDAEGRLWLDLRTELRRRLLHAGVSETAVEVARGCTIGEPRYHSYRRDGKDAGRMVAFIALRW